MIHAEGDQAYRFFSEQYKISAQFTDKNNRPEFVRKFLSQKIDNRSKGRLDSGC